jgi:hypothetical protein
MKKLLLSLVPLALSLIAFIILWQTFANPHQEYYDGESTFPFAEGNALTGTRDSIQAQLEYFAKGYLERDVEKLEEYCSRLISKENILILGTMPQEIYSSYEAATELIRTDWLEWGDVHYLMDQAHVSVQDEVAWISTIGYVEFDMSRFLVLPLRYSAVMVKEEAAWKFQQMQFQFDLDNLKILMAILVLLLSTAIFLIRFIVILIRYGLSKRNNH